MKDLWCPRADEYLFRQLDTDRSAFEREFQEINGYPLPWCEVVGAEEIESLSWDIGRRLGMERPTITMEDTLSFLWNHMPGRHVDDDGKFRGWTEPIDDAVKRIGIPADGLVVVLSDGRPIDRGDGHRGLRIRMKSVIEGHFWHDETFIIDDEADWALCGMHDYPAYFWQFPKRR